MSRGAGKLKNIKFKLAEQCVATAAAVDAPAPPPDLKRTAEAEEADAADAAEEKVIKESPRSRRRQSSSTSLQNIWAKLLPGVMTHGSNASGVRASGIVYVLTKHPDSAVTNTQAVLAHTPHVSVQKMRSRRQSSTTISIGSQVDSNAAQAVATPSVSTTESPSNELEWQPRIYEISMSGVLSIQCCGLQSDAFVDCLAADVDVTQEEVEGCAQLAAAARRHKSEACIPRYVGSSPSHAFVKASTESPVESNSPVASEDTASGLRQRRGRGSEPSKTYDNFGPEGAEAGGRPDSRTVNLFELKVVSAAQVTTAPLSLPLPVLQAATKDGKPSQEPQDLYNPMSKFLKAPVLRLVFSKGNAAIIMFVSAAARYSGVTRDERVPLTYGKSLEAHLTALQEARAFVDALKGGAQDVAKVHLPATLQSLAQQCSEVATERRRYTLVFNGSVTDSVGHVYVLVWCIVMLYTTLRPTALRIFVFTMGTALFITAERWLHSDGGTSFFRNLQDEMRRKRETRGDHITG